LLASAVTACNRPADPPAEPARQAAAEPGAAEQSAANEAPNAFPETATPTRQTPAGAIGPAQSTRPAGNTETVANHGKTEPNQTGKVSAPAQVSLTTTAVEGTFDAVLEVRVTTDVPRVVDRFVLPTGVSLVSGQLTTELGALSSGEQRKVTITVSVPAGASGVLAAGANLHLASGVRLHQGDSVRLGTP
jgi:hypothetical protein